MIRPTIPHYPFGVFCRPFRALDHKERVPGPAGPGYYRLGPSDLQAEQAALSLAITTRVIRDNPWQKAFAVRRKLSPLFLRFGVSRLRQSGGNGAVSRCRRCR